MSAVGKFLPVPLWSLLVPTLALVAAAALMVPWSGPLPGWLLPLAALLLLATVLAAVHHAETIAARLGDPYGAILLAVAVTIIEVPSFLLPEGTAALRAARANRLQTSLNLALEPPILKGCGCCRPCHRWRADSRPGAALDRL